MDSHHAENPNPEGPGPVFILLNKINTYLSQDFLGGPRWIKMSFMVNLHKFMSAFIIAGMMLLYHNHSAYAWIYLALHGTYGFCWILKHFAFRDNRWEIKITTGGAMVTFLFLGTYWIAPILLISGAGVSFLSNAGIGLAGASISLFGLGLAIMTGADAQKYFSLRLKKELITNGMFRYIRHPNYLGEMMIYASFALLVRHWIPWLILLFWWIVIFMTNMKIIEASLSRYPGWKDYKARTGLLFPKIIMNRS